MDIPITFPGGLKVDVDLYGTVVHTDQPVRDGGDGTGPSPYGLFLASLAACAGYFALAFCKARNIPTDDIKMVMRTESRASDHLTGKATIEMVLPPTFPERYREALVKSVSLCTVKRNIAAPPEFEVVARVE